MGSAVLLLQSAERIVRGHAATDARRVELVQPATFGRSPACDVQIETNTLGREHFAVEPLDGAWWARDLGSTGGTFVNGVRGARQRLKAGDRVHAGSVAFLVERV